jgi:hypothetical protein
MGLFFPSLLFSLGGVPSLLGFRVFRQLETCLLYSSGVRGIVTFHEVIPSLLLHPVKSIGGRDRNFLRKNLQLRSF